MARLTISNDRLSVDIEPELGGRIAQLRVDDHPMLVDLGDVPAEMRRDDGSVEETAWGSFPMVPWAGRIRRGRFEHDGVTYQLPINFGAHAIHGVGFSSVWTVTHREPSSVRLRLELPSDERWPFGGDVTQDIAVEGSLLSLTMEVRATDRGFPVSFGWHPWFRKPERVDFRPMAMFRRDDDGIADGELVAVPPGPWDDCFTNIEPVRLRVAGVDLLLSSDCPTWVVYDERAHATCVEPQTGPPDAFTIARRVLAPGESHRAWFHIDAVG